MAARDSGWSVDLDVVVDVDGDGDVNGRNFRAGCRWRAELSTTRRVSLRDRATRICLDHRVSTWLRSPCRPTSTRRAFGAVEHRRGGTSDWRGGCCKALAIRPRLRDGAGSFDTRGGTTCSWDRARLLHRCHVDEALSVNRRRRRRRRRQRQRQRSRQHQR